MCSMSASSGHVTSCTSSQQYDVAIMAFAIPGSGGHQAIHRQSPTPLPRPWRWLHPLFTPPLIPRTPPHLAISHVWHHCGCWQCLRLWCRRRLRTMNVANGSNRVLVHVQEITTTSMAGRPSNATSCTRAGWVAGTQASSAHPTATPRVLGGIEDPNAPFLATLVIRAHSVANIMGWGRSQELRLKTPSYCSKTNWCREKGSYWRMSITAIP